MSSFSISKTFRFEAAHRLTAPYQGKCLHMHGHSFKVRVVVAGEKLDARGMVVDFSELNGFKDWIKENLDHATLVSAEDSSLLDWLNANGQKHFVLPTNPTSEILAKALFEKLLEMKFVPERVEISETCSSSATYHG